jgi:hypothetical protein
VALDLNKLNLFVGQFVVDLGAAVHSGMVVIGEKLGLYKALAEGPLNSAELAAKTRTDERYAREWLASQAAGGYITYDEQTRKFSLGEEQGIYAGERRQSSLSSRGIPIGSRLSGRSSQDYRVLPLRRRYGLA